MATKRRRFGRVRQLPSGRWQARYPGPDGIDRPAPNTFRTKTEAEQWLVRKEAELLAEGWTDPDAGKIRLGDYAATWIEQRGLAERSIGNYRDYLRRFVEPYIGHVLLIDLNTPRIRSWFSKLEADGVTPQYRAKTYRFLHAVLATAEDDELIKRNPCRIKGAGQEYSPERPTYTMEQIFGAASAIQPRYRLLVLLAAFAHLRYNELMRLTRADIDLVAGTVSIRPSDHRGKAKSRAGVRRVALPPAILPDVKLHLDLYAEVGPAGRIFVGPKGATPSNANFNRLWHKALDKAGLPHIHFHDLRHTGNTLVAPGASLKELMRRMGHSSTRAAIIYQHATDDRDRELAADLSKKIDAARQPNATGMQRARDPKKTRKTLRAQLLRQPPELGSNT